MGCPLCGQQAEKDCGGWCQCPCGTRFNPDMAVAYKVLMDPNTKIQVKVTDLRNLGGNNEQQP